MMRRSARLTQSDLARKVGLSQSMISLYESGQVNLMPDHLLKVRAVIAQSMPKGKCRLVRVDRGWEEHSQEERDEMEKDQLFARVEELEEKLGACQKTLNELMAILSEHIARTEPAS